MTKQRHRDSTHSAIWRRFRVSRVGVTIGIVAFLVLGGTGAFAYWNTAASVSTSAQAGTLAVTSTWSSSLTTTFTNVGETNTGKTTKTGEITVTNTTSSASASALPYSVALAFTGANPGPLATKLGVTVWKKSGSCNSVGSPSSSGTWTSPPAISGTLVVGASTVWCIRTTVDERSDLASTNGSVALTPTLTVTLTAGSHWTTTSSVATGGIQKTEFVYPAATVDSTEWYRLHLVTDPSRCLDIKASGGANTELIDWGCHENPNQQFQLSGADSRGYLAVAPRHIEGLRWDNGGSNVAGTLIRIQNTAASGNQAWQLQEISSSGVYQIVNKFSGLCIEPGAALSGGQTAYYQAACDGSNAQRFTLEFVPVVLDLVCSKSGSDVTYSWDSGLAGTYTFQAYDGSWKTIGTSVANAGEITIDGSEPSGDRLDGWSKDTYDVRALDSHGNVVGTNEVKVNPNSDKLKCN